MSRESAVVEGLRDHAIPLRGVDPDGEYAGFPSPFDALGDARVVGLGEATHGTFEFFKMKHKIIKYLVKNDYLDNIILESNFSESLALDDYARRDEGDPQEALGDLNLWPWKTEEMLALVEWLREYNDGRLPADRVGFYGADAQHTAGPAAALREYLREVDPEGLKKTRRALELLEEELYHPWKSEETDGKLEQRFDRTEATIADLRERFGDREPEYVTATSEDAWQIARRHLRTLEQAHQRQRAQALGTLERAVELRDEAMAENVSWILAFEDADGAAVWAHNEHVLNGDNTGDWGAVPSMGHHLDREYGEDYYAVGFDFARGSFQALPDPDSDADGGLQAFSLDEPLAGSVAARFDELDGSLWFLDIRSAAEDPRLRDWLDAEQRLHQLGALFDPDADPETYYKQYALAEEFDGLVFVRETSRAVPLGE